MDEPSSSSTAIFPARSFPVQQEAYPASYNQPCSFCHHSTLHVYLENMEPDNDTGSNLTDPEEDEESNSLVNNHSQLK
eukprot:10670108-Prorocentrum_lima.AAC.1